MKTGRCRKDDGAFNAEALMAVLASQLDGGFIGFSTGVAEKNAIGAAVVKAALDQKLLIVPAGPKVVRMVPALVISRRNVAALLPRLERTLQLLQA